MWSRPGPVPCPRRCRRTTDCAARAHPRVPRLGRRHDGERSGVRAGTRSWAGTVGTVVGSVGTVVGSVGVRSARWSAGGHRGRFRWGPWGRWSAQWAPSAPWWARWCPAGPGGRRRDRGLGGRGRGRRRPRARPARGPVGVELLLGPVLRRLVEVELRAGAGGGGPVRGVRRVHLPARRPLDVLGLVERRLRRLDRVAAEQLVQRRDLLVEGGLGAGPASGGPRCRRSGRAPGPAGPGRRR